MLKISNRLTIVPASPMRRLIPFEKLAVKKGVKIYHLNIGDPDIKTPAVMIDVLKNWKTNPIAYSPSQGLPEFIESLKKYYHHLEHKFIKSENIQVTTGGSEAISMAMFAVGAWGDEIIVFEPFYANYNSYAAINGIKLVPVVTVSKNGFHLPPKAEIEKKITKKTKAILFCNPGNPTGTVYTKEELQTLVKIAQKHDLFLISDEVYREFTYDGRYHISLLDFMEKIPNQAIMLDSLSKRYSLCGARLGVFISLNSTLMAGVLRMAQSRLSSGLIDQTVATKLTKITNRYFKKIRNEYEHRRNVLYEGLKKIPGVFLPLPEGAFYAIVRLPVKNAEAFCQWLLTDFRLNNETVMLTPATGFYADAGLGTAEVRIAYVLNARDLKKSIEIIKCALQKYSSLS